MSHFTVVVFSKDGTKDDVTRLLAPFDENDEAFRDGSRWDWWRIGGRWDGVMLGLEPMDDGEGGFNFDDRFESLERNSCPPAAITPDFAPWAFVTPDGEWIEKAQMGWWATPLTDQQDSEEQWQQKFAEAKGAFADTTAVLVDCHV